MQSLISQLLIAEHDVILGAGDLVFMYAGSWKESPEEYEQNINRLLDFFSLYADEYHHIKEEEILFPEIGKKNELVSGGIIQELLEHHEYFRNLNQNVRTALDAKQFAEAQELLETYVHILKDHIAIENDELFPMADDIFSADELEKLYHRCVDKDSGLGLPRKETLRTSIKKFNTNEEGRSIIEQLQ